MATSRKKNQLNPYHILYLDEAWTVFKSEGVVPERYWDSVTAAYCIPTDAKHKKRANAMYKWIQKNFNF